ncbi:hypothetical protein GUJ93_ZPchr0011g28518 [Zizania palustris]|uniref:Uncharacterized protein n=1 Tax=Zizania palustris TaxID=103762 RepID=A0A8J6BUD1_ZIZPA|nr:hypothetical protein GUJ93_ZPchr0011g28518 [Zizania palustris]
MPPHLALHPPPRLPVASPSLFVSLSDKIPSADDAYFVPEVIAYRDGSGSFPKSRLNDGYYDCADGIDEPGLPLPQSLFPIRPTLTANCKLWGSGRFRTLEKI